mgnify:CR=1 FL=1
MKLPVLRIVVAKQGFQELEAGPVDDGAFVPERAALALEIRRQRCQEYRSVGSFKNKFIYYKAKYIYDFMKYADKKVILVLIL